MAASGTGDPHFHGFNGDFFHFNGEDNKWFNLFSSTDMQVNALFKLGSIQGGTTMQKCGIKIEKQKVEVSIKDGSLSVKLNEEDLPNDKRVSFKGKFIVFKDTDYLYVTNGDFLVKIQASNEGESFYYLNFFFSLSKDIKTGLPHGIVGQTIHPKRLPKTSGHFQGEGVIDGRYQDYKVRGMYDDNFKFNRFGVDSKELVELTAPKQIAYVSML